MAGSNSNDIVFFDIESEPDGVPFALGAIFGEAEFRSGAKEAWPDVLKRFDRFCEGAIALCGHNILDHDLPILEKEGKGLSFLALPAYDTLVLSPLAFPENPYHRLIKDYKLVSASKNDPVADSRLARSLFEDERASFREMEKVAPFLGAAFFVAGGPHRKMAHLFGDGRMDATPESVLSLFFEMAGEGVCPNADLEDLRLQADFHLALSYAGSWLTVAGGNSVLPSWVRQRFPLVCEILSRLREIPCCKDGCPYCDKIHNPRAQLEKYYGFPDFRTLKNGRPLQLDLVTTAMKGDSLLGILPTGGGKSLCYQLPALVRYQQRGLLTVIISPLQALMKDQVDNLKSRLGTEAAASITGMLTPQERGAVLDGIHLGDVGLLYLSPEQLRNVSVTTALKSREIGCWVFDEAHCLSKWGHDFRPDYLYAARYIREHHESSRNIPQITCYTATAKLEVIQELQAHFRDVLGVDLVLLEGGVSRENLVFDIQTVEESGKEAAIVSLLETYLGSPPSGTAILYFSTRRRTEHFAELLTAEGWQTEAFHAGLEAPVKQSLLERFIAGEIPVITATNAFGMGIDKEDVRLVVHGDIPGSLENYLQEAGRAGRDEKEAHCVLLYTQEDIETQFRLNALSELSPRDMQKILREIKASTRGPRAQDEVVLTTGELLRRHSLELSFSDDGGGRGDTLVKAAVSWLERAGYLERNENRTMVFQGKPTATSLEAFQKQLDRLQLAGRTRTLWEAVWRAFQEADPDRGLSADTIAERLGSIGMQVGITFENSRSVMKLIHEMAEAGILTKGPEMTAWIRIKGRHHSKDALESRCRLESAMLDVLMEEHPDGKGEAWIPISFDALSRKMQAAGHKEATPSVLQSLMKSLSLDGRGETGGASLDLRHQFQKRFVVRLRREWEGIRKVMLRRHEAAHTILAAIRASVERKGAVPAGNVLASFSSRELAGALKANLHLQLREDRILVAMDRGLLFLHEQEAIILQKGLAVFRQAMTIRLTEKSKGNRNYTKSDFIPLSDHYKQKTFQVHVIHEFARLGLKRMSQGLELVMAYFESGKRDFIRRYFKGREKMLELGTSEEFHSKIVTALGNPAQESIVTAPPHDSLLVLAGPGSGKTRTIVHRCAHLVKIDKVRPESILVLCFNHQTAVELRKRLNDLMGNDARRMQVMTYHGLALSLTGTSPEGSGQGLSDSFDTVIEQAIRLLDGEDAQELDPDTQRERLLGGIEHILVDEYQDIDGRQYELVAALAGKNREEGNGRLSLLAVGDDDQAIYGFRKASIEYIRKFEADYQARTCHLIENYRSTKRIIAASNALIAHNGERLKREIPIRIDAARMALPEVESDVRIVRAATLSDQAVWIAGAIAALFEQEPETRPDEIAVFSRVGTRHAPLSFMRTALEGKTIPISVALPASSGFPMTRSRGFLRAVDWLKARESKKRTAAQIRSEWDAFTGAPLKEARDAASDFLSRSLDAWEVQTGGRPTLCGHLIEFLYHGAREERREKRSGRGVFLTTAHGAKGLEFKHVFVLDGGWCTGGEAEEERRLFYVAMTRAMKGLTLMDVEGMRNPHIPFLSDVVATSVTAGSCPPLPDLRYDLLGLERLFLDYAGRMPKEAGVHETLENARSGDVVTLERRGEKLGIWKEGVLLCPLSRKGNDEWAKRIGPIRSVRISGMIRREERDVAESSFRERIRIEKWEIPLCDVVYEAPRPMIPGEK